MTTALSVNPSREEAARVALSLLKPLLETTMDNRVGVAVATVAMWLAGEATEQEVGRIHRAAAQACDEAFEKCYHRQHETEWSKQLAEVRHCAAEAAEVAVRVAVGPDFGPGWPTANWFHAAIAELEEALGEALQALGGRVISFREMR